MNKFNWESKKPVLIFDMNETLLDLKKLHKSVSDILGGGENVISLWFETMLHYSLVDTVSGQYHNFGEVGAAALMMLANSRKVKLTMEEAKNALQPIQSSPPHPEVPDALKQLNNHGFRMTVLTNSSRKRMEEQLENAGISQYFEQALSVEDIGMYKPHKEVYQQAANKLNIKPADCLFVAAHGWDIAGAMAAGMPAVFVARAGQQTYPLGPEPTMIKSDIGDVARCLID